MQHYFVFTGLDVFKIVLSEVATPESGLICNFLHCCLNDDLIYTLTHHIDLQLCGLDHALNLHFYTFIVKSAQSY